MKEKVGLCEVCFNLAEGPRCRICEDERRERSLICVVEEPADVIPIERTGEYRGVYHVLGGALSPIDGVDPEDLKIAELLERVNGEVDEVVLATNPTTTGEATALHIADALRAETASPSPASPAACRSAPTSSTPTRSPSARPWRAAARSARSWASAQRRPEEAVVRVVERVCAAARVDGVVDAAEAAQPPVEDVVDPPPDRLPVAKPVDAAEG